MKIVDATPRASLLVSSMRDVGYSLPSALADIIDNSIAAAATTVHILADPQARHIAIVDDGRGMGQDELFEIMRPGSRGLEVGEDDPDLGRFGLGLKSASFSQCKRLTVVSKQGDQVSAAMWDLDYVVKVDKWLLQVPEETDELPGVRALGDHGTVVIWEELDRVAGTDGVDGGLDAFTEQVDEARKSLELVFHRYLTGERGARKVAILMNFNPLVPYDPFHEKHKLTMSSPTETIGKGGTAVQLQAFTLPHHKALSPKEWEYQGGDAGHLRNQGFYLYREKRLIIHGTWFGLLKLGELSKLSRVRLEIGTAQDSAWKIDIRKAFADPPTHVKKRLRELVDTIAVPSRRIYTARAKRLADTSQLPVWERLQTKDGIAYVVNQRHPMVASLVARLAASEGELLKQVLLLVGAALPVDVLFADVSDDPHAMTHSAIPLADLRFMVQNTVSQLIEAGMHPEEIVVALKSSEPFRSNWDAISGEVERVLEVNRG